jgi:hypothetical protein
VRMEETVSFVQFFVSMVSTSRYSYPD